MAAEGGGNIVWFTYTGADGEQIPHDATHITIAVEVVPPNAFEGHRNIIEVICHKDVKKIGRSAFAHCPSLRRVIMPGVKIVKMWAFNSCRALTDVECGELEIIGQQAFGVCTSLRSINLPSVRIVGEWALVQCIALTEVKFGNKLERVDYGAFFNCIFLERITLPLTDGLFTEDDAFQRCDNLKHVDLVEGVHETIASLQLEEWRNDVNREIDSIKQILPNASANLRGDNGEKSKAIRRWMRSVLRKIIHYQAEHRRVLDEGVTSALELALPCDTIINSVLPFLELPSHTFEVEYDAEDLFIFDDEDGDWSDENKHRCCCLRKLWPFR